jgi:hypothetical protein
MAPDFLPFYSKPSTNYNSHCSKGPLQVTFLKEKEALYHHFCILLYTLLTTQHKLHISTNCLMTHLVQQHCIYNNNWKIQFYICIYVINRDKTIPTSRPVNNYSVLYNLRMNNLWLNLQNLLKICSISFKSAIIYNATGFYKHTDKSSAN